MLSAQQVVDQAEGLAALALVITNPDAYTAKRDELKQYAQDGMTAFDKAQTTLSEANKLSKDAAAALSEANQIKEDYNLLHSKLNEQVDLSKSEVLLREQNVAIREQKAKQTCDDAAVRMQESLASEKQANQMLVQAKVTLDKANATNDAANALKSNYESKLKQLRDAVSVSQ